MLLFATAASPDRARAAGVAALQHMFEPDDNATGFVRQMKESARALLDTYEAALADHPGRPADKTAAMRDIALARLTETVRLTVQDRQKKVTDAIAAVKRMLAEAQRGTRDAQRLAQLREVERTANAQSDDYARRIQPRLTEARTIGRGVLTRNRLIQLQQDLEEAAALYNQLRLLRQRILKIDAAI